MKKTEVLAPAGSYESLVAAVNAGADAVYMGGSKFGARAYADNPDEDMFLKGLSYAHHHAVKVYMTVNTLLKEEEIEGLVEYIKPYYESGLDAVIVQDLGVFSLVRKHFPDMEIHISTQMSLMGEQEVLQFYKLGASRVVPARELSLEEIKRINETCDIDIECFVHGALCYAYSGQCLMSSMIGGRSANRGRCAQTCRLDFNLHKSKSEGETLSADEKINSKNSKKLLSCKDLCSLDVLPDMIEAGVDSLKIEGRMKSARYTAGVVSIWRKYVDLYLSKGRSAYEVKDADRKRLLELFDRGGQTQGYAYEHNGKDMIVLNEVIKKNKADEAFFAFLDKTYVENIKKIDIDVKAVIKKNKAMQLSLYTNILGKDFTVSVDTLEADEAKSRSATKDDIAKQLLKMGNTLYEVKNLDIELDDGLFVANKLLNDLRRGAVDALEAKILGKRIYKEPENEEKAININTLEEKDFIHVVCEEKRQLDTMLRLLEKSNNTNIKEISFEADTVAPELWSFYTNEFKRLGLKVNLYTPHIFRLHAKVFFKKNMDLLKAAGFDGYIIRSLEAAFFLNMVLGSKEDVNYIFDYNLYAFNSVSKRMLRELGADRLTLPLELNINELKKIDPEGMETLVYGRIPLMISAQCLKKTSTGCDKKSETLILKDRYNADMPVKNKCTFCYNTIYNAKTFSTLSLSRQVMALRPSVYRIWFSTEDGTSVERVIKDYVRAYTYKENVSETVAAHTKGHLKRGVE